MSEVKIGYRISEEAHKWLKLEAVKEGITEEELLDRIILKYVEECKNKGVDSSE